MKMSVAEVAALVGGVVVGDGNVEVTGVGGLEHAQPGDLSFVTGARYAKLLVTTSAAAALVTCDISEAPIPLIQVSSPYEAFVHVLTRIEAEQCCHPTGIHPTAIIGQDVHLGDGVALDAFVRIGDGAHIEAGSVLYAGVYVGHNSRIGRDCVLYPNVVVRERVTIGSRCILHSNAVIGSDGFGFHELNGKRFKIPQVGVVVLGDDVEIGACSAVDRAMCDATVVGAGTKIDNHVQIAHNVRIGCHNAISGQSGVAGSTTTGDYVTMGAQTGIGGHIRIGDHVLIGGRSGVTRSIGSGEQVSGFPAQAHQEEKRIRVAERRLPEMLKRLNELEKRIQELEEEDHG